HPVARRLIDMLQRHLTEADRDYVVLFLLGDIERAWCEASEGRPDQALSQLDALLARYAASDHPLVHGMIHEARALIAHSIGREDTLTESALEVERWFRPTANPSLIARCERVAALRTRARIASGRRESPEVVRWLELLAGYERIDQRLEHGVELVR